MSVRSKAAAVCIAVLAAAALAVAESRPAVARTNASPNNGQLAGSPSTVGRGSPGWDQLDPYMQNVILNGPGYAWGKRSDRRHTGGSPSTIGRHSPGWDQLDPYMQNVILNGPGYAWGK
jgi:hypothetical protein